MYFKPKHQNGTDNEILKDNYKPFYTHFLSLQTINCHDTHYSVQ